MATMPLPMNNPTGATGSGNFNGAGTFSTSTGFQMPGTGGSGNMNFGNTMNPNPSTPTTGTAPKARAGVTQNPGSSTSTGTVTSEGSTTPSQNPYGMSQSQQNWMEKYLQETYGGGMGAMVYQYLMSNGGYNSAITQQAVDSTVNSSQQQIQLGANNLASMMGSSGVSSASSGYGSTLGQYENQAQASLNQITSQDYMSMWQQSQQNELNAMEFAANGTATTLANKPNWMDYLNEGLGVASAAVGMGTGISEAGSLASIARSL